MIKTREGVVVSDKMTKTRVVVIERLGERTLIYADLRDGSTVVYDEPGDVRVIVNASGAGRGRDQQAKRQARERAGRNDGQAGDASERGIQTRPSPRTSGLRSSAMSSATRKRNTT